jgi:integrase
MPRKNPVPTYRKKKIKGWLYALVTLPDGLGGRKDVMLGRWGSKESKEEYNRVLAEWTAAGGLSPALTTHADMTVSEMLALYVRHVEGYYRHADGTPTNEVRNIKSALRWMKTLYGRTLAREFTTVSLEAIRDAMIRKGLCRKRINKDIARIRRLFRWAGAKRIIPAMVFHELATLEGLRAGRSAAKETEPIGPVSYDVVQATLPYLPETIADLVRLQMETGMRSGELLIMRTCDLDRTRAIWSYRPASHKTKHHGHERVVWLGPKSQEIVARYLKANREAFLFSPAESMRRFREKQRQNRKSKVQPSQQDRSKNKLKRRPGLRYTPDAYGKAIAKGIERVNRDRACEPCKRKEPEERCEACRAAALPHWHPHQLRHALATRLRKEFDLDTARTVLGHRTPAITATYAEADQEKAARVMGKIG